MSKAGDKDIWTIQGTISELGKPRAGISVEAFDRDLRKRQPLGIPAKTGKNGSYRIEFTTADFAQGDRKTRPTPWLVVRASEPEGGRKVEVEKARDVQQNETVDLAFPADMPSEFERHVQAIRPLLEGQNKDGSNIELAMLEPDDIDFIASDTGIERQHIAWLQLAFQTGTPLNHEYAAACCYGWFRLGIPSEPATLWATPAERLMQTLKDAITRRIIPAGAGAALDAIEAEVRRRKATQALHAPRFGRGSTAASLSEMLAILPASLDSERQQALAVIADELRLDDPKLVERIAAIPGLDREAPAVARTLRLGALTQGNAPLAHALQERLADDGEAEGTLRPLAALRQDQWIDLAYAHGTPQGVGMAPADYADQIAARVERAYPTAALAVHLEVRRLGRQPALGEVGRFLRNNPSFDIATANLRSPDDQFNVDGIERRDELFAALRGLQRMQMLGTRWGETAALYEYGVTSPHRILMEGPAQLNRLLEGEIPPDRINGLYDSAREMFATSFAGFTAAFSPLSGPKPLAGGFTLDGDPVPPEPGGGPPRPDPRDEALRWLRDKGITRDFSIVPRIPPGTKLRSPREDLYLPPEIEEGIVNEPTLQAMFGPQDSCACKHCLSVLSPAAYFVDVLQYLKNAGRLGDLFARRPDLQDLELSCENTDTEVPAIDLALEILENAAALPMQVPLPAGVDAEAELSGPTVGASVREALEKTVRGLKETVRATPSGYSDPGTTDWTVVDGHRRWTLTVHKRRLRALTAAGTTIPLEVIGPNVTSVVAALNEKRIDSGAEGAFATLLGANRKSPPDLTNYELTITPLIADRSWRVAYRCVAELEIDGAQSALILRTPAAIEWHRKSYHPETITAVKAELAAKKLHPLVAEVLADRFPGATRFTVTAAGTSRWKVVSADRTLMLGYTPVGLTISSLAFQSGDTTVDAIAWPENHNPAAYALLKAEGVSFPWTLPVDLPLEEVRLFLSRARSSRRALMELMRPITQTGADAATAREVLGLSEAEAQLIAPAAAPTADQILAHWGLTANRTRIWDAAAGKYATATDALGLLKNVSILLQQSRLSFEDLEAVLATSFVQPPGSVRLTIAPRDTCVPSDMRIDALTLAHLERIHCFVRLQRRLEWSVTDLDTAIRVSGAGVLTVTTLEKLADLVRLVEAVEMPPSTVLAWWVDASADGVRKRERELARALKITTVDLAHAMALFGLADAFASPSDTLRLCDRMAAIRRRGISFEDLRYLLRHDPAPASDVELTAPARNALAMAAYDAVRSIPEAAGATKPLDPAAPASGKAADVVVAALASRMGTTRELVDDLLRARLRHPAVTTAQAAVAVFLDNTFFGADQLPPVTGAIETVIVRLHKAVALCTALSLGAAELRLLRKMFSSTEPTGLTTLDFNTLPSPAAPAAASVTAFEQLLAVLDVRDLAQGTSAILRGYATLDFSDPALAQNVRRLLAAGLAQGATADDEEQVRGVVDQLQIGTADAYRDPVALLRLLKLLMALKQLGAKVADAKGFIAVSPTDPQAQRAREVLRLKFSDRSCRELVKPIADKLRQRQRDALVEYLIARDNLRDDGVPSDPRIVQQKHLRDANDLYEHYLIDMQTSSCMTTTRLLAATAAAQLFVQRCMLNLEVGVPISQEKRDLWGWMHRYRVWEANRKVFLFPENWLLPELRDDKTAIFRQMEGALADQEPSLESTREALVGYLEELGEQAQIATVAMYDHRQEVEGDGEDRKLDRTLYVVGRTPNQTYKYYWRSCVHFGDQSKMFWSGWEALELDNANDYLMPFVFEGDLHIAWPTFRSTTDEAATDENAIRKWEVQLAWIRRSARGWTKRKFGKEVMLTRRLVNKTPEQSFTFRLSHAMVIGELDTVATRAVEIHCYAAKETDPNDETISATSGTQYTTGAELQPAGQNARLHNSWVTVSLNALATFQPDNEPAFFQPLPNVILFLEYEAYATDREDRTGRVATNPTLLPRFARVFTAQQLPKGLWIKSGSMVKAWACYPGSPKLKLPAQTKQISPDKTLKENGEEYEEWKLDYTVVFDTGKLSPSGALTRERRVDYEHAGAFRLDSLHDVSVAPQLLTPQGVPPVLPSMFDGLQFDGIAVQIGVVGNGFSFNRLGSHLPVPANGMPPVTTVDRGELSEVTILPAGPLDETVSSLPSYPAAPLVLYVRDAKRRFFVSIDKQGRYASPDGHAFVGWYRRLTAASTFRIFDRSVQARSLDQLDAAPPLNALRTVNAQINFDRNDTYANYNWELFLHLPLAVADYLARQQRFEDARRWLHAVFDPTAEPEPKAGLGFWKFLPFDNASRPEAIAKLLTWLVDPNVNDPALEADLNGQIENWKRNPFMPHLVARLRPSAYQWYAFFAYVELLIGWGDQLFRRDTRESVNAATLLYVLAAKMLGPRPRDIPANGAKPPQTYRSLPKDGNGNLAQFSEAWLGFVEHPGMTKLLTARATAGGKLVVADEPRQNGLVAIDKREAPPPGGHEILASLSSLAFCIPRNNKLDELHELVGGRLRNIRHCRNIEGVPRDLPLYEPPIDPLLLIKAKAAGLDLDTVLASYPPPTPHYRFATMLQKANELAAEVKALGTALLAALEKKDAEELALMRSRHEIAMLTLVRDTRQRQIDEADAAIKALQQSQKTVSERFDQYQGLLGKDSPTNGQDGLPVVEQASVLVVSNDSAGEASGLGLNSKEINQLGLTKDSNFLTTQANMVHILAGVLSMVPNFSFGLTGGIYSISTSFGGSNLGSGVSALGKAIEMLAADRSFTAGRQGTLASYERRQDEWVHQSKMALAELKQLNKQIVAAEIRQDIAKKELESHEKQIEHAKEIDEFFREKKFTNKELYRWMSSKLAEVYFRGYQLALDLAQRAEKAFQHELGQRSGEGTTPYVKQGYWDSLKNGLLAGEQLSLDLKRLEAAYLEQNKREYEITKHISVSQLDPVALILLKETGECSISIPEVLFDLDYPGHYFRRLKSVALSIPCVAGPYVNVSCKLTLTSHACRRDPSIPSGGKYEASPDMQTDKRFVRVAEQQSVVSVVTSSAQNDSGLFETNLRDERYLPFEGAGAISEWKIELPKSFRAFDYGTISDVILHLRFTAKDGGNDLKTTVEAHLQGALNAIVGTAIKADRTDDADEVDQAGLTRVFSLRHEFASEWYCFVNPTTREGDLTMTLPLSKDRFPAIFRDPKVRLEFSSFEVLAAVKEEYLAEHGKDKIKLSLKAGDAPSSTAMTLEEWTRAPRFLQGRVTAAGEPRPWTFAGWLEEDPATHDHSRLDPHALEDVVLICRYTCKLS